MGILERIKDIGEYFSCMFVYSIYISRCAPYLSYHLVSIIFFCRARDISHAGQQGDHHTLGLAAFAAFKAQD